MDRRAFDALTERERLLLVACVEAELENSNQGDTSLSLSECEDADAETEDARGKTEYDRKRADLRKELSELRKNLLGR